MLQQSTKLGKTYIYLFRFLLILNILGVLSLLRIFFIPVPFQPHNISFLMQTLVGISAFLASDVVLLLSLVLSFILVIVSLLYKKITRQERTADQLIKAPLLEALGILLFSMIIVFAYGLINLMYYSI